MSRFTIKITETDTETTFCGGDWEKGAADSTQERPDGYGYSPQIEKKEAITREVFSQNTDDLDLVAVIKAVNGI